MLEKVKEQVQIPAAFLEYYVDDVETNNRSKHIDFDTQLHGFARTIDQHHVCKKHPLEELKQFAHLYLQASDSIPDNDIPKEALYALLTQELLASSFMGNLLSWAWTNVELQLKSGSKTTEPVDAFLSEWSEQRRFFHKLNPMLMLKAWGFFKQGQLHFHLECEALAAQIEKDILNVFQLSKSHIWLDEFITHVKNTYILPKLTRELTALAYDQMVPSVMPLVRAQFRQLLRQEKLGSKPLLLIYPHGKSGVMMLVINKNGDMIDESMIYPFAPDYDEEHALIHFSKLMMKYPNEHVVWMIKPETRKPIQSLLNKFRQRYPDLSWKLHGITNLLSQILVKTKSPQINDVIQIGHFMQNPAEILATINCMELIHPLLKNLPHAQIQAQWHAMFQEFLLFSGLDIQKASPTLLNASQLFSAEEIKKIIDKRENAIFDSKLSLQNLLDKDAQAFNAIAAFIRIDNPKNPIDNSFFLSDDQAEIDNICQQLHLEQLTALLHYPAYKLKTLETHPSNRIKKLLHVYQQFHKNADIYDQKNHPDLTQISKHHVFFGSVTKIMPYGAFIDLGQGLEGLLHQSAFIHGISLDPKLMLNEGDTIKVEWLNYDAEQKRLSLKYHSDYFIPKAEVPKKPLAKPHLAKKTPKPIEKKVQTVSIANHTPTAMALAFAKLKESPTSTK